MTTTARSRGRRKEASVSQRVLKLTTPTPSRGERRLSIALFLLYLFADGRGVTHPPSLPSLPSLACEWSQVIEVTDGAEPREQRVSLSMKLVDQTSGKDLDPSNAEAETDVSGFLFLFYLCVSGLFL